jgi:hypothetical protein
MQTFQQTARTTGGGEPFLPAIARMEAERGVARSSRVCGPVSVSAVSSQYQPQPRLTMLLVSDDVELTNSRRPILEGCGFAVHDVALRSVMQFLSIQPRFIVLCQTIPSVDASRCNNAIRDQYADVTSVRFSRTPAVECGAYDLLLSAPVAPRDLVVEITKLRERYLRLSAFGW